MGVYKHVTLVNIFFYN